MSNNEKSMKNLLLIAGASVSMVLLSACGDAIDENDMDDSKTQPVTDQNGEKIEQPVDDKGSGDSGGNSSFFFMWLGGLGGGGGNDSGVTDKKTTETTPKKDESKTNKSENKATDNKTKPSDTKTTKPRPTRGGGFGSGATNRGGGGG